MKALDVGECAFDAIVRVVWWWVWFGIVSSFLGNAWGFVIVLAVVFLNNLAKKRKGLKGEANGIG